MHLRFEVLRAYLPPAMLLAHLMLLIEVSDNQKHLATQLHSQRCKWCANSETELIHTEKAMCYLKTQFVLGLYRIVPVLHVGLCLNMPVCTVVSVCLCVQWSQYA